MSRFAKPVALVGGPSTAPAPGAPAGVVTYALIFHDLPATSGRDQLPLAMEGSTLAKAAYIGRFRRPS